MSKCQFIKAPDGSNPITHQQVQEWRNEDRKNPNKFKIIAQNGGQENMLSTSADIMIGGGSRGGSKSFSLLLEALNDVNNSDFRSVILRNEIEDLSDLVDTSTKIYTDFGEYNRSKNDMTWNFHAGGWLKFAYHAGSIDDFRIRFQGKQYAYIGVDEITHMDFLKFKYLLSCNRNAFHIRNRFIGTCNPDPDSWVARFIEWWIDEEGNPIPDRNGMIRYCFMDGEDVSQIYWGNTRDEVYQQCKAKIDQYYLPQYKEFGEPKDLFVKSATFIEAKLADNVKLLSSDPTYLGNLMSQSEEQRSRDLAGNWKRKALGDDIVKTHHMEALYNAPQMLTDNTRRASCDAAFDGGDNLVMCLWQGMHIKDIFACQLDSRSTITAVKAKLEEWGVHESNFTYDLNGLGQSFKGFFKNARPFNNMASVDEKYKYVYGNLKSQCMYILSQKLINTEISIEPTLLDRKYSGKGYSNVKLRDILMQERKAIRRDDANSERGWTVIKKQDMKKIVGHSPDFIEAMMMRMIFEIKNKQRTFKGLGFI